MRASLPLIMALLAWSGLTLAHEAHQGQQLPVIGPAPPFTLTSQDTKPVEFADLRGKVVALAFIYTGCPDICPLLTQKMIEVQDTLGANFGAKVAFVSITLRPGAGHARGAERLCPILGRQARGLELPDWLARGGSAT